MSDYTHVLEHLLNTPLLAHEEKALTVAGVVLGRHGVEVNVAVDASVVNQPKAGPLQEEVLRRRYEMDGGKPFLFAPVLGVAVIEITGSLSHRQWRIGKSSGVMGYDGIGAQLDAALRDPEVRAIALDVHSDGGEVAGAFQLADRIFAARDVKPIVAIADERAFSAAYLLSAAAGEVWLASEVAQVGSIGAVVVHMSFEEMIRNEGVKVTVIRSAPQKAEGNPYEDLSAPALARVQARIDAVAAPFVSRMAAWRGLTEQAIRATEAGTFMGRDAVAAGLADGIADPIDIILALARSAGAPVPA